VAVAGALISLGLALRTSGLEAAGADDLLSDHGEVLAASVDDAFHQVEERLVAVGAFYQGSEEVTLTEFRLFVANFEPIPGMGGIGYVPIVDAEDLDDFEAGVGESIPGYFVFQLDQEGNRIPVEPRSHYMPVLWFEPAEAFGRPHGFDSGSDPTRRSAMARAQITRETTATAFVRLISEEDPDGFLVYRPVQDRQSRDVVGFAVAPMDLAELLDGQIPTALADDLSWAITDVTNGPATRTSTPDEGWTSLLDVGGRRWELTVTPTQTSRFLPDPNRPFIVFVGGLVISLLAAVGVSLHRRKSQAQRELNRVRELGRAKDQFLASVSHELRTPLTGVLGFAEVLRDDPASLSEPERKAMIGNVADEAADLASIIDDLLVAARAELDLLTIHTKPVSLRAQAVQVLENGEKIPSHTIEMVGDGDWRAVGDPSRVRQIIRNLITNARRYGGDRIQFRFTREGESVGIEVADDGTGLPHEEWDRIFEPYYRAHSEDSQPAALGIGLSLSRHLARLMGGELTYRHEDGWSVFRLALPAADPVLEPVEAISS
jgi:signal transduction histidine kinase